MNFAFYQSYITPSVDEIMPIYSTAWLQIRLFLLTKSSLLADVTIGIAEKATMISGTMSQHKEINPLKCRALSFEQFKDELTLRFETDNHAMYIYNIVAYYILNIIDGKYSKVFM